MIAENLVRQLRERGLTVAVAESLTGGLLSSTIVDVPGASAVYLGSVTSYSTDSKAKVLGVDSKLLDRNGPVDVTVAKKMAEHVRELFGADIGVATTGVAGPEPQGGQPVGLAYIAVSRPPSGEFDSSWDSDGSMVRELRLSGSRQEIREQVVRMAIDLVESELETRG